MRVVMFLSLALATACAGAAPTPVAIDPVHDACDHCRMIISNVKLASQVVAPGDEPLRFDDIGCLQNYLRANPIASDAVVFVTDHRTGEWLPAARAVFAKTTIPTPMGSGIVAHRDAASFEADALARGGQVLDLQEILTGQGGPEAGR